MLREEEEEGEKGEPQDFSLAIRGVTRGIVSCLFARYAWDRILRPSRLAAEVFNSPELSAELEKQRGFFPALPRARNQRTWPGISRTRRPRAEYRGARARRGAAPCGGPAWQRRPRTRGLQSVVPATELEAEQKAPVAASPQPQ